MRGRFLHACAALALAPLLSGCIAAVAVVGMTAFGAMDERRRKIRSATPVPTVAQAGPPRLVSESGETFLVTTLTALPPGAASAADIDRWQQFVSYTLDRSTRLQDPATAESALLAEGSATSLLPTRRPCPERYPAVIVDLDDGPSPFVPGATLTAAPGLAESLARLRAAEVTVLWISSASANQVQQVADALRSSGLDPTGRDPLLLVRHERDRKQLMREEANLDVCVIAVAGDRRSDFDELFEYLRLPEDATPLDALIGNGWFLTPPPFETSASPAGEDGGG